MKERPEAREAQRTLAREVTERVHGAAALKAAEEVSQLLFGKGDPRSLSREALNLLEREIPTFDFDGTNDIDSQGVINAVTREGGGDALFKSRSEARRALEQGGVYLNGERLSGERRPIASGELLHGQYLLVRKGARSYALVRLAR
jgi:tyrosyl-tRNA synthetase